MKKYNSIFMILGVIVILILIIVSVFSNLSKNEDKELIYFVSKTKSENSTFWHSVERGVQVAVNELGIDLIFVGPEREIDLEDQIRLVEEGISKNPSAIILAVSDYEELSQVSQKVIDEDIIFVTVDSDVDIDSPHSFVATNNIEASKQIGHEMAKRLSGQGKVGIISHLEGTTSSIEREEGFKLAMNDYKDIELVSEIDYSNNDAEVAYEKTLNFIRNNPDTAGLFGTNEATLAGMARAIDELGLSGEIVLVGFDMSLEAAGYIEDGTIQAIVVQRPFNMGYLGVMEAYNQAFMHHEPREVDVDIVLITRENLFDEENQKFLIPFLE